MRPARCVVVIVVFVVGLAGCWKPTGSDRCDRVLGAVGVLQAVDDHGWVGVNCAPPGTLHPPARTTGWADEADRTVYLWLDQIGDSDAALIMFAGHEDGHVVEAMYRHPPDEGRASEWSWCNWPQIGVGMPGYGPPPGGCAGFIP